MEFQEKARVRIEHWLDHNKSHVEDYQKFAEQLEEAGMQTSAGHIREMIAWTAKSNACLEEALATLA
jgi:hypothetical protein